MGVGTLSGRVFAAATEAEPAANSSAAASAAENAARENLMGKLLSIAPRSLARGKRNGNKYLRDRRARRICDIGNLNVPD